MARHDNRQWIAAHCPADRAGRPVIAHGCREFAVGHGLAERHVTKLLEHFATKPITRQAHREVEVLALASKILRELRARLGKVIAFGPGIDGHVAIAERDRIDTVRSFASDRQGADR